MQGELSFTLPRAVVIRCWERCMLLRFREWIFAGNSVPNGIVRCFFQLYVGGSICTKWNCTVLNCLRPALCFGGFSWHHTDDSMVLLTRHDNYSVPEPLLSASAVDEHFELDDTIRFPPGD